MTQVLYWKAGNAYTLLEHPRFLGGVRVAHLFSFFFCVVLLCVFTFWVLCCDARYNFRINTTYLRLFGLVSYLRWLCLLTYSGVQHILYWCFCLCSSWVPCVVSFSGLSIYDCLFSILQHMLPMPDRGEA